ncbi:class I SAM-dependent methyltransferase [Candidatus Marinimicrobia bacterium]|nr:class I SAM-dependent methyltransferase [Candidatus Neomarinimicrobiota bacterium]|tara:strand:+ start:2088 stop:2714 length:627 start_codon:yes stop_codon:yes gene_type:complete
MKNIMSSYNGWAHQYDNDINPTRDLDKTVTKEFLSKIDFFKVLELGCGSGKNTEWLIAKADSLIGLDFSKKMLDLARKKIISKKVTFINADLNGKWPVRNNSFDLATINLTLEHIEVLDHIFNSLFMKLSQGGKCFVCELHPKKQLEGSKAQFEKNGTDIVLDVFQHSEKDYIQSAEKAGFKLLTKQDWYSNEENLPRLISFLFEKLK